MRPRLLPLLIIIGKAIVSKSQITQDFIPGAVPHAIRSPYYNAWVISVDQGENWPKFWNNRNLGWSGLVRIDGVTWEWLGGQGTGVDGIEIPKLTDLKITPTRTIYTQQAGNMRLTITYLNPIEPMDLAKQSIPFTYTSFEASSTDGQVHNVQVFAGISAEWCSGNRSDFVTWNTNTTANTTYHSIQPQDPVPLTETTEQAEDAVVYFATPTGPNTTQRIGVNTDCRVQFAETGSLSGDPVSPPGIINSPFVNFALAIDLGNITNTQSPVVWSLGVVRNESISYTLGTGETQIRYPFFFSQWSEIPDVIDMFLGDFSGATSRAITLDNKIMGDASAISSQYASLVSLSAKQVIGSSEITISQNADGTWNTSDVKIFMKDVGRSHRVNPVEVLYAAFPFFLYMNPSYCGQLLAPLLEFQASPLWTQPYAAQDVGIQYPQASGSNLTHNQGIEQSGNMLIMMSACRKASGDSSLVSRYYNLLTGWANYLVNNTLSPTAQFTADSESYTNSTNLALKGIIAIRAMAEISEDLGENDDAQRFLNLSSTYADTWHSLALSSNTSSKHVLSSYGDPDSSWSFLYNLYADRLLQTTVIDESVYELQTNFYRSLIPTGNASQYGLSLSSVSSQVNSAWALLVAATVTDASVRDSLISQVYTGAHSSLFFPPVFDQSVNAFNGSSSPAQGAMFSLLVLSPLSASGQANPSSKRSIVGPVVGGVIGGVAIIAIVVLGITLWRRRRNTHSQKPMERAEIRQTRSRSQLPVVPYNYDPFGEGQAHRSGATLVPSDSPPADSGPVPTAWGGLIPASKERVVVASSAHTSQTRLPSDASSTVPTSDGGSRSGGSAHRRRHPPTSEIQGLRAEVEGLRQVVRDIQAERSEVPPPGYHDVHPEL